MIVHKLSNHFFDDDFKLIAIHTTMEDYQLVYFLNKILKLRLVKNKKEDRLIVNEDVRFSYYHWNDESSKVIWHCFANKVIFEKEMVGTSLFATVPTTNYLIDNKKKVDFFLKIDAEERFDELSVIKKIMIIPNISAVYTINIDTLSSKHKLIFQ
ncbi:MAG: IPExxxVDY family protein [Capnocytophaga sp.]|nr:IPExxxVDY family protein [Capnocytophaga sp.]